jgi:hypothetical protein
MQNSETSREIFAGILLPKELLLPTHYLSEMHALSGLPYATLASKVLFSFGLISSSCRVIRVLRTRGM